MICVMGTRVVRLPARILVLTVLAGAVGACSPISPAPPTATPSAAAIKPSYTLAPPTPSLSAVGSPAPGPHARPYAAADIHGLFVDAGPGFPAELRTEATAEALANVIWSFDGRPFRTVWLTGSCESGRCEVSATGLPHFAASVDEVDVYTLVLDQASGIYSQPSPPYLRGFPPQLVDGLDRQAKALDVRGEFRDKPLLGVEWQIPPPDDAFLLRYGNGNEEQDPTIRVILARRDGRLVSISTE